MSETAAPMSWEQLSVDWRHALTGKLDGLYGQQRPADAFNALAPDKQQALCLILGRFLELDLWSHIRHIENAYGEGGVGIEFQAWPSFSEALRWHPAFTSKLAKRPKTEKGFRELRVRRGALHILYFGPASGLWNAHFDMFGPLFSPANTFRHIWNEVVNSRTPDWRMVSGWLKKKH